MRCVTIVIAALSGVLALAGCADRPSDGPTGVTGFATVNGEPAAGAEVNIYDRPERSDEPAVAGGVTARDGTFSVQVGPGTYYVVARQMRPERPPLLSKLPPAPVTVGDGFADAGELKLAPESGEEPPPPHTGVEGMVTRDGTPVPGAIVYLYDTPDEGLKGPTHRAFGRAGLDGGFRVDVPPGTYYLAARRRFDASSSGELHAGDLGGEYENNPVTVKTGEYAAADIGVSEIDAGKLGGLDVGIPENRAAAVITGTVTDPDGRPLRGVHVFAYTGFRMMGKPQYKSNKTGTDGTYTLTFDRAGKYYIGARDTVGGPLEPGDMVGVYGGTEDNSVALDEGGRLEGIDIVLRELQ